MNHDILPHCMILIYQQLLWLFYCYLGVTTLSIGKIIYISDEWMSIEHW
jgi:hypothetical protein